MQNNEKKYGLISGISLIIMALAAGFSFGYVQNSLLLDSAELTYKNLLNHRLLFFAGLSGWVIIFITDLIVAFALFRFFRTTSGQVSKLTAVLRIIYTMILGVAIFQLFSIIPGLSVNSTGTESSTANEVVMHFQQFEKFWSLGLIIFGLHLIGLGFLSVKSPSVPVILGYLLYLAGISYSLLHTLKQINLSDADFIIIIENILSVPMALSEILLAFWLIYKGIKKERIST